MTLESALENIKGVCTNLDAALLEAAVTIWIKEDISIGTLTGCQLRGLVCYYCITCNRFRLLTELFISKKKTLCSHCQEKIRLYTTSNKYGKIRRSIFDILLKIGVIVSIRKNDTSNKGLTIQATAKHHHHL
jgi:hypothetical protein